MKASQVMRGFGSMLLLLLFTLTGWSELSAQTTTGTIRGRVLNDAGDPVVAAEIRLTNTESGAMRSAISTESGAYALPGLAPGTYELRVQTIGYAQASQRVRVLIGQTLTVDLRLQPQAVQLQGITVVGTRVLETRTSEIATNVTEEQMRSLPQPDRNFLNFAGLAPGITVSQNETNKQISAAGLAASKINVFVDGASFKNDILEGGVHGQDASRGNPFPQIAVQEFRVITQNFKAEYQRAASAIVTATTRSGTNQFEVNGFVLGQNKGLVERNPGLQRECNERSEADPNFECAPKPEYERFQMGLSAGGPITRDRLHYFVAYENNIQDREATVALGRPEFRSQFGEYEGTFAQPFRSHLGVAKLSYQPAPNQTLSLSWNGRFESDKRGFGGQRSFEAAEDVKIGYNVLNLQHGMSRGLWFNQAQVSAQRSTWNPTVLGTEGISREYMGVIITGAKDSEQNFRQDRIALRNDLTRTGMQWNGDHVIKGGVNLDFLNYKVEKWQHGNPTFFYDVGASLTAPAFARWGSGDPGMEESNVQFGAYIQDDWDVTPRLQLNLGVRWDAETNMFNNKWVTPDSVRTALGPILTATGRSPEDYFTRGTEDRPMYLGAFQPRVGFSYDVLGTGRTIVHGGFGVYYDREIWNHLIDERFRLNWIVRFFDFTTDPNNTGRILWRPEYESTAGLQSLVDRGGTGVGAGITSEIWLLKNDSKPPRSNQFNVGIRQTVEGVVLGAAYRGVRSENLTSWYCAKSHSEHGFCEGTQELGSRYKVLLSTDEGRSTYDAFDITAEKPFIGGERWGASVAYTMAQGKRKGWDFFTFDFLDDPAAWPMVDSPIERHRVVASGIVGLPWQFRLSTLMQWSSGVRYSRIDETIGWGPARARTSWYTETGDPIRQVDLRLHKEFLLPRGAIGLTAEAINVFNEANYRNYQQFERWGGGEVNANFRKPELWSADPGRRMQLGLDFRF
jgi:hypothetical protein